MVEALVCGRPCRCQNSHFEPGVLQSCLRLPIIISRRCCQKQPHLEAINLSIAVSELDWYMLERKFKEIWAYRFKYKLWIPRVYKKLFQSHRSSGNWPQYLLGACMNCQIEPSNGRLETMSPNFFYKVEFSLTFCRPQNTKIICIFIKYQGAIQYRIWTSQVG